MTTSGTLRLLVHPPAPGGWNMAVDEWLLEQAGQTGCASLRFYQWQEPTLSLGYFQRLADRYSHAASTPCPVVRRATGGGAILHDCELTYSLVLPRSATPIHRSEGVYRLVHLALCELLAVRGVTAGLFASAGLPATAPESFLCFQRRSPLDVVVTEVKVCGSAQRRHKGALLQHGSLLLTSSAYAPELPGLGDLTGVRLSAADLIPEWSQLLAETLQMELAADALRTAELEAIDQVAAAKYAAFGWLHKR